MQGFTWTVNDGFWSFSARHKRQKPIHSCLSQRAELSTKRTQPALFLLGSIYPRDFVESPKKILIFGDFSNIFFILRGDMHSIILVSQVWQLYT
ncbi:hypothetical protein DM828_08980 [Pseudomonas umsongensis]|jgi:hypothetical protein|nr:hypothetical protein [Pseudomonas umsongensis]